MKSTRADTLNVLDAGGTLPATMYVLGNPGLYLPATLLGGLAVTVDYQQNYQRQSADRDEIRNSAVISF